MFICLNFPDGSEVWLPHQLICEIRSAPDNPLESLIGTTMQSPKTGGYIGHRVLGTAQQIAAQINQAELVTLGLASQSQSH